MGGGQGGGMMGYGQGGSNLWGGLTRMFDGSNQQNHQQDHRNTETLRREIQQARQELASLYETPKPNKKLINEKIQELNRLEAEFDREMAASEQEGPARSGGWSGMGY
jgi:U3 small nucleolar ribonucleoprotein component